MFSIVGIGYDGHQPVGPVFFDFHHPFHLVLDWERDEAYPKIVLDKVRVRVAKRVFDADKVLCINSVDGLFSDIAEACELFIHVHSAEGVAVCHVPGSVAGIWGAFYWFTLDVPIFPPALVVGGTVIRSYRISFVTVIVIRVPGGIAIFVRAHH